jgi:PKD repeat protein
VGETFSEGWPACYYSHVIGTVLFGNDGTLLVGSGDAASYNHVDAGGIYPACFGPDRIDPNEDIGSFRSIYPGSLAGKILRLDPETGLGLPSNPFYDGDPASAQSRTWVSGLRNPFRFSINDDGSSNPADGQPGTLYIGDVGWNTWEDLNVASGGENFGWPCYEGPNPHTGYQSASPAHSGCNTLPAGDHAPPTYYFRHQNAHTSNPPGLRGAAIVVGDIYRGTRYPAAQQGQLFYADYARGWMAHTLPEGPGGLAANHTVFSESTGPIVDLRYDPASEYMYLVNIASGSVMRMRHAGGDENSPPVAIASASPSQGAPPLAVQFTGSESFDPDGGALTYSWDFGDGATSDLPDPGHTYTEPGTFTATLTVRDAFNASASTTVEILVAGEPPVAAIAAPLAGTWAAVGEEVILQGTASGGAQDPASLHYAWSITQVHNDHDHPDVFTGEGPLATFVVPEHGLPHEVEYYRIALTVTDDFGLTDTAERFLLVAQPRMHEITGAGVPVASGARPASGEPVAAAPYAREFVPAPEPAGFEVPAGEVELGFEFDRAWDFTHVVLEHPAGGGFFSELQVAVRQQGAWAEPDYVTVIEPHVQDGRAVYNVLFAAASGDAIRITGTAPAPTEAVVRPFALLAGDPAPEPWTSANIGYNPNPGWTGYGDGLFGIAGFGDIWGTADRFHYTFQPMTGDGQITARIHTVDAANAWAKAGLMIRGGTSTTAAHASLWATPGHGRTLQARQEPAGETGSFGHVGGGAPSWLRLVRQGNAVRAYVSASGEDWSQIGSVTLEIEETVLVGMAVTATDFVGANDHAVATFSDVTIGEPAPPPPGALPEPWASTDIGFVRVPGSATYQEGRFTVTGAGDAWGASDGLHYAYRPMAGDGVATVLVESIDAEFDWAKLGLMVRESTAAASRHVSVYLTPGHGVQMQGRAETGGPSAAAGARPNGAPVWLRIRREGDTFTALASDDGAAWSLVGSMHAPMAADVLVGLAATSTDYQARYDQATLVASGFSLTDTLPPDPGQLPEPWLSADVGPVAITGSAQYDGGVFTVEGSGDAWGNLDRLHMAFREVGPQASLTAFVESLDGVHPWRKGGLMIRASLDGASSHAAIYATGGRGTNLQHRAQQGGASGSPGYAPLEPPVWLRLQRDGDLVAAYASPDGAEWTHLGSVEIDLPENALMGMAVTPTDYEGRQDTAILTAHSVMFDDAAGILPRPAGDEPGPAEAFAITTIFPNPLAHSGTVEVALPAGGMLRLELYDMLGRRVWQAESREEAGGRVRLPLALGPLPSGTYVLRAIAPDGGSDLRRLTVVR